MAIFKTDMRPRQSSATTRTRGAWIRSIAGAKIRDDGGFKRSRGLTQQVSQRGEAAFRAGKRHSDRGPVATPAGHFCATYAP
jgi:hypothetical protein